MSKTRVELLFGFLGSGKTTLARRILTEFGPKRRLALIVNEFGDVGVDGEILRGNNIDVVQLSSGCLCCTLKGSLIAAMLELVRSNAPLDHLVVEATGVAEPEEVLSSFHDEEFLRHFEIGMTVTVVDTPKFLKIREMLGPFYESQAENADFLILNKLDRADAAVTAEVEAELRALNRDAVMRHAEHCDVALEEILDGPPGRAFARCVPETAEEHGHAHDHGHSHDHRHAPAQSLVIDLAGELGRAALERLYAEAPDRLWRSKGFARIDGQDCLVQVAMGSVEITPVEPRARHYLVFIGDGLDAAWFETRLAAALVEPAR